MKNNKKSIYNNKLFYNLSHIGDILAIPFFFLLIIYFNSIPQKNILEYILLIFSLIALLADIFYSYDFFYIKKRKLY
jgi:hypothetical protein